MLQSLCKNRGAEFLCDQVQQIILKGLGDPADHGHGNGHEHNKPHSGIFPGEGIKEPVTVKIMLRRIADTLVSVGQVNQSSK